MAKLAPTNREEILTLKSWDHNTFNLYRERRDERENSNDKTFPSDNAVYVGKIYGL